MIVVFLDHTHYYYYEIAMPLFGSAKAAGANVSEYYLGDNCIQNFHLGRYIVEYTVGNLVLR